MEQPIENLVKQPIVLVGMIGTGKSTVGKKLAKKLNSRFYDSDQVIELREGMTLIDIHDFKGREYLAKKEEEVISEILGYGKVILSTGGSSILNPKVREQIKKHAIAIWLDADFETIFNRVTRRNTRPELYVADKEKAIRDMMKEREEFYMESDIKVQSSKDDAYFVLDSILFKLRNLFQAKGSKKEKRKIV